MQTAVVILNWNGEKFLEIFLPFVVKYSKTEHYDVIVADNASSDNSIDFLKKNYPSIQLIFLEKNFGFAEGYNRALQNLDYKYFVLLNSDVELTENWLKPIISKMETDSNLAAAMPKIRSFHEKLKFEHAGACGGFIDYLGYPFCRGRILENLEVDENQYDSEIEIFWATGACFVVRAEVFREMGGFDGDFFAHMEEIDLCWRIKNAGYSIRVFPQSVVYHVGGGTLSAESPFKLYLNFRNNLYMLFKNLPLTKLFPILFFRMTLDGISALIFLMNGKYKLFWVVFKSHLHFYKALPNLIKKRKTAKKLKKISNVNEIFKQSIVFNSLILRKKQFSDLNF